MAMLAGPRRKQKVINLRAKNNAWSNDNNKFGQRMLEKMGWSSGKGLGAKENGIVEHVVARFKNDEKGLGFEDKNDQWTKHEDDFNSLLANLSNADGTQEKLHSGVSLEVKSKKSKARVHYHKFTRGKDLTRYSEKDLANIFGKKSLKEEEKAEEPLLEDLTTAEQVFTEKGSMDDYFKSKLANFKSKSKLLLPKSKSDDNADFTFKGFSTNVDEDDENDTETHVGVEFSFYNSSNKIDKDNGNANVDEIPNALEEPQKNKKKKKKSKNKDASSEESNNCENATIEEIITGIEDEPKVEKKSKKKRINEEPFQIEQIDLSEEKKIKKKKSKNSKNDTTLDTTDFVQETHDDVQESYVPKKKKKRKNKE